MCMKLGEESRKDGAGEAGERIFRRMTEFHRGDGLDGKSGRGRSGSSACDGEERDFDWEGERLSEAAGGRARDGEGDDPTGKTNGESGREGGLVVRRQRRWRQGKGGSDNDGILVGRARSGRGRRGGSGDGGTEACDGSWTPFPSFREQPLKREKTHFFSQMTARVCGRVPSPLIEPITAREGKGPT